MSLWGDACMAAIDAAPVPGSGFDERSASRITSSELENAPLFMRCKIKASTSGLLISMVTVYAFLPLSAIPDLAGIDEKPEEGGDEVDERRARPGCHVIKRSGARSKMVERG
jgi:hypothetical protein